MYLLLAVILDSFVIEWGCIIIQALALKPFDVVRFFFNCLHVLVPEQDVEGLDGCLFGFVADLRDVDVDLASTKSVRKTM